MMGEIEKGGEHIINNTVSSDGQVSTNVRSVKHLLPTAQYQCK